MVSPQDALWVIDYLNTVGSGVAEGESVVEPATVAMLSLPIDERVNVLVTANDEGDTPQQATTDNLLLGPLTGFPESEALHEARLWGEDRITKWTDEDLEEILAELAGELVER